MIYLQCKAHTIQPSELIDIANQLDTIGVSWGKFPYQWHILSEDEVKEEYEVEWIVDKLNQTEKELEEAQEELEDLQKLYDESLDEIEQLKEEIKNLTEFIQ
jgi:molecular chaperone GrpE (heat shock protein)